MEAANNSRRHKMTIDSRARGDITGIKEVESFDAELVSLSTEEGRLVIKGKDLHVVKLDVDKGELEFSGRVDGIAYSDQKTTGQVTSGMLKRLFK